MLQGVEAKRQLIVEGQARWKYHLTEHPEDKWMEEYVYDYPDDPEGCWQVVLIPVCRIDDYPWWPEETFDDIKSFGTSGGDRNAHYVFSKPGVAELLQAFCVEFIVGCVDQFNFNLATSLGIPLGGIAFKGPEILAIGFANFVNNLGGSLRWNDSDNNQCLFESE